MNLNLTGNHVEITPAMREYVTTKLSKVTRHFDHVIDVSVILSVEKHVQKAFILGSWMVCVECQPMVELTYIAANKDRASYSVIGCVSCLL